MSDYHIPVLLQESLEALKIRPDGIYVDATYGAGGHSIPILKQLNAKGHLYSFDQDADVEDHVLQKENFTFVKANFRYMWRYLKLFQVEQVDGVLMDLGVSSHQLDMADRGFSYRFDAPLDMRMNQLAEKDARFVLNHYSAEELQSILSKYGEVRNAKTLARKIVSERNNRTISTTFQLNEVLDSVGIGSRIKYYSQVYQAVRIEVNDEMLVLEEAISGVIPYLSRGGRLVVISYHSLEDRIIKNFIKAGNAEGKLVKDDFGVISRPLKAVNKKLILPSKEEIIRNSRARSAKMRIGEKV